MCCLNSLSCWPWKEALFIFKHVYAIFPSRLLVWSPHSVTGKANRQDSLGIDTLCLWEELEGECFQQRVSLFIPWFKGACSKKETPEVQPWKLFCGESTQSWTPTDHSNFLSVSCWMFWVPKLMMMLPSTAVLSLKSSPKWTSAVPGNGWKFYWTFLGPLS